MSLKSRLIKKLHEEFPEVKFKKAELITKGFDHDVLVLDGKLIFRFAKVKLKKDSFVREVKFLNSFAKISNLKVPYYSYLSKDKTFGGYKIIEGRELTPKIYKSLPTQKKQKIIRELAKFLTILHAIPTKRAKAYGFKKYNSWTENRNWFKTEYEPKVYKKLKPKQIAFIKNFTDSFFKSKKSVKPVLGHFDLSHDHIFINKAGDITGIIDFGDVNLSDPAREFNGFLDFDKNLASSTYKLYRGPKDANLLKRAKDLEIHRWIFLLYDGLIRRKNKALWRAANKEINKIIKMHDPKRIIWLTGASGVGKTTLLSNLKDKYSSKGTWEFLKFDSIGVPSTEDMVRDFGSVENWQKAKTDEWVSKLVKEFSNKEMIIMDGQSNLEFIKLAFEKQAFTNYKIILVDCEQAEMVKRLTDERQQAWLASEDMKNWLKFLRNQAQTLGAPIINTSKLDKAQTLQAFEKII